jgi:hypothetical protein
LVVALANFIVAKYRHEQHPQSLPSPVGREVLIFAAVTIIVYMILYACEWSWNYVVISPAILDKQRTDEISALSEKLKLREEKSGASLTFATLVGEGNDLLTRMITSQGGAAAHPLSQQLNDWIKTAESALKQSGLLADASIFVHCGEKLSPEQTKALIPNYIQRETWKHYDVARLSVYLAKFQEIVERKNL